MSRLQVWLYLYGNRVAILGVVGNLATAAVKTAPAPGTPLSWGTVYAWGYDWFHQVLNLTNNRVADPKL
jgi:hypothetical protein